MTAYDELFPAEWDLIVHREGVPYWALGLYCHTAECRCTAATDPSYELKTRTRRVASRRGRDSGSTSPKTSVASIS
jgi:hypothetical protein